MDSLDARIFVTLGDTLSFSETADLIGGSRSMVSKRIQRLENELGVKLVNRSSRSTSLTDAGKVFLERCREIEHAMRDAVSAVEQHDLTPAGPLTVSLSTSLASVLIPSITAEFMYLYPKIRPHFHVTDRFVDVIAGGYDVALRITQEATDTELIVEELARTPGTLVASPGYVDDFGTIAHPSELSAHRCIGLSASSAVSGKWRLSGNDGVPIEVDYSFSSDNDLLLKQLARHGGGIYYAPRIFVAEEIRQGKLVELLAAYCLDPTFAIYVMCPGHSPPTRVQVFLDYIRAVVEEA